MPLHLLGIVRWHRLIRLVTRWLLKSQRKPDPENCWAHVSAYTWISAIKPITTISNILRNLVHLLNLQKFFVDRLKDFYLTRIRNLHVSPVNRPVLDKCHATHMSLDDAWRMTFAIHSATKRECRTANGPHPGVFTTSVKNLNVSKRFHLLRTLHPQGDELARHHVAGCTRHGQKKWMHRTVVRSFSESGVDSGTESVGVLNWRPSMQLQQPIPINDSARLPT